MVKDMSDENIETSATRPAPAVTVGSVAANLFNDLGLAFRRIQQADAFEAKVLAAAKSPRDWMMLREELSPMREKPVEPEAAP